MEEDNFVLKGTACRAPLMTCQQLLRTLNSQLREAPQRALSSLGEGLQHLHARMVLVVRVTNSTGRWGVVVRSTMLDGGGVVGVPLARGCASPRR